MPAMVEPPAADGAAGEAPQTEQQQQNEQQQRRRYRRAELEEEEKQQSLLDDVDSYEEYVPLKKRKAQQLARIYSQDGWGEEGLEEVGAAADRAGAGGGDANRPKESLLAAAAKARKEHGEVTEAEKQVQEEKEMLAAIMKKQALMSVKELAQDVRYTKSMATGWKAPLKYRYMSEEKRQQIRDAFHISCDGHNIPPPLPTFRDMKLPESVLRVLASKNIKKPTPIQIQGLPVALSGRDMIGIAFTGSGKTLVFTVPMVLIALQEEMRMPMGRDEGPIGMVMCPSRELAKQTHEIVCSYAEALKADGYPELRAMLCMGGMDMRAQLDELRKGLHIVVATPGRLKDLLHKKRMNLMHCRYLCLDEADRMVDLGFEEEVRDILSFFSGQRQTLMFSATMPAKIKTFAETALVDPVEVNVGRAGAANLDVIQEVEYVKEEAKLVYLLECLQKTAPPVLVFAENKKDVDTIHEYLLIKGVEAVAVHGDKDQEERETAIREFKAGRRDVLVATDVASKGLDFPDIQHVINFDMPDEIENYVHRIGRTGRCGKTGVATTFVNTRKCEEQILLDLKHLLKEAKQRVPHFLQALEDPMEQYIELAAASGVQGCAYCGGLGHRIGDCPKLRAETRSEMRAKKDHFGNQFGAEM